MARYDVVVIGAGLGGLTAGAILARAGRKVLVIERSNSVGGAASSYKSGDLFIEGSLHETSDPLDPRDPKHGVLTRAGVIDAVKWIPTGAFYEARGGPLDRPLAMPDNFDAARRALTERFPKPVPESIDCSEKWSALHRQWERCRKAATSSAIRAKISARC
jgi:choline dehydrogenase-like flavoprotein